MKLIIPILSLKYSTSYCFYQRVRRDVAKKVWTLYIGILNVPLQVSIHASSF